LTPIVDEVFGYGGMKGMPMSSKDKKTVDIDFFNSFPTNEVDDPFF
jgi:hypothetical protein